MTTVIHIDATAPDAEAISRAAACIRAGGLVAFPTETVYGLGASALDRNAVRRIFEAKGRPSSDPLIVHISSFSQLDAIVARVPVDAEALARRFWPGPLTLVLPRHTNIPDEVTAGLDTVAVRLPSHPVAHALLTAVGIPVAAPSANLFSRPSPTHASHVVDDLGGRIDLVLDAGATPLGVESTVVDLTGRTATILRPGGVTIEALREVLGDVEHTADHSSPFQSTTPLRSPGLLAKHYSPRTPLTLYEGERRPTTERLVRDARAAIADGLAIAVIVTSDASYEANDEPLHALRREHVTRLEFVTLGDETDLATVATRFYAVLRDLDTRRLDTILVRNVATPTGLGAALRDRLARAAGGRIVTVSG